MSSPAFRFVHAADLHLDAPFHGLRRASPAISHALGEAPLTAWDALVQLTIDQNAAFLLLAGDICDGAGRAVPAHLRFLEGLQRLSAHGVRTFIIRGDDDPAERWMGIHQWPSGVYCFGSQDVESVAVTTAAGQLATIHGISHSTERTTNRVARFRRGSESGIHIGVLHASVGTGDVAPWDCCSINDLQTVGMDYWALGHDHRHQRLSDGHPWIVYPGTLQGRSLNGDETGPKGAVVVTVTDGVVSNATHHALDAVRLMRAQVDVSTLAGTSDLRRALFAAATRLRSECTGHTLIATCEVVGRGQAWMGGQPADGLWDRLLEELRQEHVGGDTLVWWDSVLDMTEAREIRTQNDVSVHVHRVVEVLRRAPAGVNRLLSDQNVPLAGSAVLVGQSTLDPTDVNDLLTRAERAALSLLEREEP
jgi:exonuclease SbcD